jgi:hypothetical protein
MASFGKFTGDGYSVDASLLSVIGSRLTGTRKISLEAR